MNQISWSNTVIVAYSALPQLVKTIDFGVKSRIDSGFGSKHLRIGISTFKSFSLMKTKENCAI